MFIFILFVSAGVLFKGVFSLRVSLISLTEDIWKNLDKGNIDCRIFVDLQKAFDTLKYDILLAKLEHYGIRGVANEWFRSNLCLLASIKYGVPQGSVLEPLLYQQS